MNENKVVNFQPEWVATFTGIHNYNQVTNYYPCDCLPNPFRNLDSLLEEALELIDTAIQRDYREFLEECGADIEESVRELMRKVEKDELVIKVNKTLERLDFYNGRKYAL